jgi:predicted SnoaL-like aldol condensation-catalyzing enzyme
LGDGALFIVGADLAKAPEVLLPAYDDADGVTAAFNRNLLVRISRELGASLDPDAFEHRAVWNEVESRIEMHLVSSRDQTARIGSRTIVFSEGEVIHTESSHKYRPESFEALVERGGWRVKAVWTSDARSFGVFLLDTEGLESVVERHITDEHRVEPTRRNLMSPSTEARNKAIVLEAFDTLFNKRDYVAAERFWSPNYVQHSAHIEPGRDGLFNLIKSMPPTFKHEHEQVVADGQFVIVHSRFSGFGQAKNWVVADFVRVVDGILVEHWDVVEDEASQAESKSGRPMFGERFPAL